MMDRIQDMVLIDRRIKMREIVQTVDKDDEIGWQGYDHNFLGVTRRYCSVSAKKSRINILKKIKPMQSMQFQWRKS